MQVDSIGNALGSSDASLQSNTSINQNDFLKLFMTELNFQDPLQPLDNREFLAQIAQFSALEQTRQTVEGISNLALLNSASQSVAMLGKKVDFNSESGSQSGVVQAISFSSGSPLLTIKLDVGTDQNVTGIRMAQISLVR